MARTVEPFVKPKSNRSDSCKCPGKLPANDSCSCHKVSNEPARLTPARSPFSTAPGLAARKVTPFDECVSAAKRAVSAKDLVVLDVRTREEFAGGHVEGAINAPNGIDSSVLAQLGARTGKIALYCETGRRSAIVMEELARLGYSNLLNAESMEGAAAIVGHLRGARHEWTAEPTVTLDPNARLSNPAIHERLTASPDRPVIYGPEPQELGASTCRQRPFEPSGGCEAPGFKASMPRGGPWTQLRIDNEHANLPTLDGPVPMSPDDLARPIPVVTGGEGSAVLVGHELELRLPPQRWIDWDRPPVRRWATPGGYVLPIFNVEFEALRIGDVVRSLARSVGCRFQNGEWVAGRSAGCPVPVPSLDEHGSEQRTYTFAMAAQSLQVSIVVDVWGAERRAGQFDLNDDSSAAGGSDARSDVDGVFVGLGSVALSRGRHPEWPCRAQVAVVGAGASQQYGGIPGGSFAAGGPAAFFSQGFLGHLWPSPANAAVLANEGWIYDDARVPVAGRPYKHGLLHLSRQYLNESQLDALGTSYEVLEQLSGSLKWVNCNRLRFDIEIQPFGGVVDAGGKPLVRWTTACTLGGAGGSDRSFYFPRNLLDSYAVPPPWNAYHSAEFLHRQELGIVFGVFGRRVRSRSYTVAKISCVEARWSR